MFSHINQHQVGRDRCDLTQSVFAELALNIVFCGETKAAMGLQAGIRRLPNGDDRISYKPKGFKRLQLKALLRVLLWATERK